MAKNSYRMTQIGPKLSKISKSWKITVSKFFLDFWRIDYVNEVWRCFMLWMCLYLQLSTTFLARGQQEAEIRSPRIPTIIALNSCWETSFASLKKTQVLNEDGHLWPGPLLFSLNHFYEIFYFLWVCRIRGINVRLCLG